MGACCRLEIGPAAPLSNLKICRLTLKFIKRQLKGGPAGRFLTSTRSHFVRPAGFLKEQGLISNRIRAWLKEKVTLLFKESAVTFKKNCY